MRQLTFEIKMEALELYLRGLSTNDIVTQTGISKGAVVSIIRDAREGKFPDLRLRERVDELHSLSVRLRKEGLDLVQAKLGFALLKRLWDLNIEPGKISEWIEFCSEISPDPPEDFIPAAMDLFEIEKETNKGYAQIASESKELSAQRDNLASEVADLKDKEIRAGELKKEIEDGQQSVSALAHRKNSLETAVASLNDFLCRKSEKLGISPDEFETKFNELISLEDEVSTKRNERNKVWAEVEALTERQEKLSARMEKVSSDFERDIKLIRQTRDELVEVAEMKGKYEKVAEDMEWAEQIIPFLRYPDKVDDPDFMLASAVVGCIDKWLPMQNLGFIPWEVKWGDITRHVKSNRTRVR